MLRIRNRISYHILQKDLQHTTSLLIDQPTDPLHSASSRKPPDRRLRDPLNIIPENFPVTLCSPLSQTLSSLAATRHC
ncbi:hypothetical protein Hanom_Chr08g00714661 [Helianthus anomalus]